MFAAASALLTCRVTGVTQRDSRQGQSESFWENEPSPRFWQNEPNQGELAERTQFPPVSPSHRDTHGMTSFHVPLPRVWNAERTRQLIAVYRFSRSSGESFVVPAGAGVDRFPGAAPSSASLGGDLAVVLAVSAR